jgi:hypothetical protein
VKFCGLNAVRGKRGLKLEKSGLVSRRQLDVRRMMIVRTTMLVSVLNGGVASLNSLLREWEIAAGDCVEIGRGTDLHDRLTS